MELYDVDTDMGGVQLERVNGWFFRGYSQQGTAMAMASEGGASS